MGTVTVDASNCYRDREQPYQHDPKYKSWVAYFRTHQPAEWVGEQPGAEAAYARIYGQEALNTARHMGTVCENMSKIWVSGGRWNDAGDDTIGGRATWGGPEAAPMPELEPNPIATSGVSRGEKAILEKLEYISAQLSGIAGDVEALRR